MGEREREQGGGKSRGRPQEARPGRRGLPRQGPRVAPCCHRAPSGAAWASAPRAQDRARQGPERAVSNCLGPGAAPPSRGACGRVPRSPQLPWHGPAATASYMNPDPQPWGPRQPGALAPRGNYKDHCPRFEGKRAEAQDGPPQRERALARDRDQPHHPKLTLAQRTPHSPSNAASSCLAPRLQWTGRWLQTAGPRADAASCPMPDPQAPEVPQADVGAHETCPRVSAQPTRGTAPSQARGPRTAHQGPPDTQRTSDREPSRAQGADTSCYLLTCLGSELGRLKAERTGLTDHTSWPPGRVSRGSDGAVLGPSPDAAGTGTGVALLPPTAPAAGRPPCPGRPLACSFPGDRPGSLPGPRAQPRPPRPVLATPPPPPRAAGRLCLPITLLRPSGCRDAAASLSLGGLSALQGEGRIWAHSPSPTPHCSRATQASASISVTRGQGPYHIGAELMWPSGSTAALGTLAGRAPWGRRAQA